MCTESSVITAVISGVGRLGTSRPHRTPQLAAVERGWDSTHHHSEASPGQPPTHLHPLHTEQRVFLHTHQAQEQIPEEWWCECSLKQVLLPQRYWGHVSRASQANQPVRADRSPLLKKEGQHLVSRGGVTFRIMLHHYFKINVAICLQKKMLIFSLNWRPTWHHIV